MEGDYEIQNFVRRATSDFLSNCYGELDLGNHYNLLCNLNVLPMNQITCLNMFLLEKCEGGYRITRRRGAVCIDAMLLN